MTSLHFFRDHDEIFPLFSEEHYRSAGVLAACFPPKSLKDEAVDCRGGGGPPAIKAKSLNTSMFCLRPT